MNLTLLSDMTKDDDNHVPVLLLVVTWSVKGGSSVWSSDSVHRTRTGNIRNERIFYGDD